MLLPVSAAISRSDAHSIFDAAVRELPRHFTLPRGLVDFVQHGLPADRDGQTARGCYGE